MKPIPKPVYPCEECVSDYAWPAADLFWSANAQDWICDPCWDEREIEEEKGVCLADEIINNKMAGMGNELKALGMKVEQLEHERDQLKVEVESIKHYKDNHIDLLNHMIEHDAGVIEKAIQYMQKHYPSLCVEGPFTGGWLKGLRKRANQLRQKAQEPKE